MIYFYRAANIRGSQKGLSDQHCLRIGGQAGLPDLVIIFLNNGQAGLPDQHCLRMGGQAGLPDLVIIFLNNGQAGTGAGELVKLSS